MVCYHNLVEYDASISRNDFVPDGTGGNVHFNETNFSPLANANPSKDYYDRYLRLWYSTHAEHSISTNPNITNIQEERKLRSRESALYLKISGPSHWRRAEGIFFREERPLLLRDELNPLLWTPTGEIFQTPSN
ncbi:hypothetical protein K438DRAFT_1963640 [Mycena galopus ATCC 62051]|nr:hypothetical protein K438DRAFT_1963640 [Mycena galopus ATCC 62051]